MPIQYRSQARQALERAKRQLIEEQLRYAALELRLAMEALTYDRAQAYRKELPLDALAKWQPQKLMDALLEIDPTAGSTYTLRMGEQPAPGAPETMETLGTDVVFGPAEIKKHYHAIGSFLHMPTMQQLNEGKGWDPEKVQQRLGDTARKIEASLDSPVWNFTLGNFSNFECLRCGKSIHKRVSHRQSELVAKCIHCNAPHAGHLLDDAVVKWVPMTRRAPCPTPDCEYVFDLWLDEIKQGACWECPKCHQNYRIGLAILPDEQQMKANPSVENVGEREV